MRRFEGFKDRTTIAGSNRIRRIIIAGNHAQITTCEISFILRTRFKHRAGGAGSGGCVVDSCFRCAYGFRRTEFATVILVGSIIHFTKRIIASAVVHITICRYKVENITIHIVFTTTPPAFGDRVLTVHAIALAVIISATFAIGRKLAASVHIP